MRLSKNSTRRLFIALTISTIAAATSPLNPYLLPKYKDLTSRVSNWLLSNDKFSYNEKDYEGYDIFGRFWMQFRGRDLITKTVSTLDYTFSKLIEIIRGEKYEKGLWILVDKSDKKLYLFREDSLIAKYPIACGKNPGNRIKDGDGRTPEGEFQVVSKRNSEKLGKIILFDNPFYPNVIIHKSTQDKLKPTEGCITLYEKHLEELYRRIPIGTPIKIRR